MKFLQFTVDSGLLRELGEKLVETVHLALVELVKNSYDADASRVEIKFTRDSKRKLQIQLWDNGTGMNFDSVEKYWMRIATTNKAKREVSAVYGRPLTGAKGIGRFSCRRLGNHLKLVTQSTKQGEVVGIQPSLEKTEVEFPWTDFKVGTDVSKIKCKGDQTIVKNVETGTTLIISGVPEEWTTGGYNWLKRQLAVLCANRGASRKGFEVDPGFNVKIIAPDFESEPKDIRDSIIKAGWATITAHINSKHHAECKLETRDIGTRTITSSSTFPALQDISLELGIIVDDRNQIRDKSILSLGTIEEILPEWGGVQVRFKGMRVYPYGDDDWLEIDKDRGIRTGRPSEDQLFDFAQSLKGVDAGRSLLNMLSMRSYVGNVIIGQKATGFEPKSNREGFVSSPSFDQLKQFVRFVIDWSTILRDFYIRETALRDALIAKENFEKAVDEKVDQNKVIETALSHLSTQAKSLSTVLSPAKKKAFEQIFTTATEVIRKQHAANQVELAHLRLIASTSTLLLIFSHEVKSLLGVLEQSKNKLNFISKQLSINQKKEINKVVNNFHDLKIRLSELLNLTTVVGGDKRKIKAGNIALLERVKKVEKVFDLITNKYHIKIDYEGIPNNIVLKNILDAEVYSILLNVLSNAIKSVIAVGKNRSIQIVAEKNNDYNIIKIRDTGIGLHPSRYKEVFIPFISDPEGKLYESLKERLNPEDDLIVGSGSGLGLGIVKEIIDAHGGSVKFVSPPKNWNAEVQIELP